MQKKIKLVFAIQFMIIILLFAFSMVQNKENSQVVFSVEEWKSQYIEFENGVWHVDAGQLECAEKINLLTGPAVELPKGSYTMTVWYNCDENQSILPYTFGTAINYMKANEIKLDKNLSMTSYEFYTTEDISEFELLVKYSGSESFTISNVTLEKNSNSLGRSLVYLLILFLAVDIGILCYFSSMERRKNILSLLGIALLISMPLFYKGVNNGHDLMFHLTRIEGIAKELRLGHFPVRIASVWLGEYGYPTSIYYGEALLYFPAILRIIGLTVTEAYKIFAFCVNLFTVLIAEWSFDKIFKDKKISLLLTLAYSTATYRMVNMYIRSAVGEVTAWIFMPLIVLTVYKMYTDNDTLKKNILNATTLALGMTGLVMTHILSAEIAVFILVLICIVYLKKTFSWNVIRSYVIAVTETVLLCAVFLVPFLDYYLNVSAEITSKVANQKAMTIQKKGINIGDYFSFFSDPFGDWSEMFLNPGILLMGVLAVAILLWTRNKATKLMKQLTVLTLVMLFISTNVFPWDNLAYDSVIFNMLAQVQFPWRYIGIAVIFMTLLFGFMLKQIDWEACCNVSIHKVERIGIAAVLVMMCVFISHYSDNGGRKVYYDTPDVNTYFVQGEEYLRNGTNIDEFSGKIESQGVKELELLSRKGCEIEISCINGSETGYITLPVLNYKGYVVRDGLGNQYDIIDGENNLVSFYVPAGFEGELHLQFEEPWYWTAALVISAVSAAAIAGGWVIIKGRHKRELKKF